MNNEGSRLKNLPRGTRKGPNMKADSQELVAAKPWLIDRWFTTIYLVSGYFSTATLRVEVKKHWKTSGRLPMAF